MKKLPLTNVETKNIPFGPRLKNALKNRTPAVQATSNKEVDGVQRGASCKLDVPKLHSTNLLLKNIEKLKEEDPNLTEMLDEKLGSPNTAKYIRKKKAQKVNVSASKNIFKDLVSADVSQTALVRDLEENMRQKAVISQPKFRKRDPEPSLSDYFNKNEFISVRVVGPSNIFPVQRPIKSFMYKPDPSKVSDHVGIILDDIEF